MQVSNTVQVTSMDTKETRIAAKENSRAAWMNSKTPEVIRKTWLKQVQAY